MTRFRACPGRPAKIYETFVDARGKCVVRVWVLDKKMLARFAPREVTPMTQLL